MIELTMPRSVRGPARPVARLAARSMARGDPNDVLVTVDAEDVFDVKDDLARITAPTLVIGGGKDPFYPASCSRRRLTASRTVGRTSSRAGGT